MRLKRIIFGAVAALLIVAVPSFGTWQIAYNFLGGAGVNCAAATTVVNGTNFTSVHISAKRPTDTFVGAITVMFTRAAGTSALVGFEFQVSTDNELTWSTAYYVIIEVPTNETADASNVVRVTKPVNFHGISHVRLYRIVNSDPANALTACNARISW